MINWLYIRLNIMLAILLLMLGCNPSQTDSTSTNTNGGSVSDTNTDSGNGGSASGTTTDSGTGGSSGGGSVSTGYSLAGQVDSHLVYRWGGNAVYVFAGNVTPDDRDGDSGDPVKVASVTQSVSGCDWYYQLNGLSDGDYTLALTDSANLDNPATNDTLLFSDIKHITIAGGDVIQDFTPVSIIRVGPGRAYSSVSAAAAVAKDGDVVEIDSGVYQDDISVWRQNNITLRGVNGRAWMKAVNVIDYVSGNDQANGKGIWVIKGSNVTVENIEFSGASISSANGANGAGIRAESSGDLSICNSVFHDNQDGLLGSASGTLLIEHSEFNHNGLGEYGQTHNIYIDGGDKFVMRYSYSHNAYIGHNVKTRAKENHILYNRIMDEDSGQSSYDIDVPNGGFTYIIGNIVQQGPNTDNSTIISFGAEGVKSDRTSHFYVVNNTVVNDNGTGTFVYINPGSAAAPVSASVMNNLFIGNGKMLSDSGGVAVSSNNLATTDAGLVDISNFDYHLTAISPAINAGMVPGMGDGVDLAPTDQYVHPLQFEMRKQDANIDIGAYEYAPY